jgi:hypothetical protein
MILTAAAGARVETTELIREHDAPPVTQVSSVIVVTRELKG